VSVHQHFLKKKCVVSTKYGTVCGLCMWWTLSEWYWYCARLDRAHTSIDANLQFSRLPSIVVVAYLNKKNNGQTLIKGRLRQKLKETDHLHLNRNRSFLHEGLLRRRDWHPLDLEDSLSIMRLGPLVCWRYEVRHRWRCSLNFHPIFTWFSSDPVQRSSLIFNKALDGEELGRCDAEQNGK
jgi:hypothetical protein